jgi:hypothetical protein
MILRLVPHAMHKKDLIWGQCQCNESASLGLAAGAPDESPSALPCASQEEEKQSYFPSNINFVYDMPKIVSLM